MMTRGARVVILAALTACAIQGPPPGGPPDRAAPVLVTVLPDTSVAHPDFRGDAAFRFDEVISEGSQVNFGLGTGDLEKLIVLSPSASVPSVRWGRRSILVRPKEGWRPNTHYRIELLPGVVDVRSNRSKSGALLAFRTGGAAPDYTLRGSLYDWTTGNALQGALVEAIPKGDTTGYRIYADSSGSFALGPLPRGEYLVYGVVDLNRNARRERREAFDSLRVSNDSGAVGELWTYVHDTIPARMARLEPIDTSGGTITLSHPLDPALVVDVGMATVRLLPDSVPVPVRALLLGSAGDSVRQARAADAAEAARDTSAADPAESARAAVSRALGGGTTAPAGTAGRKGTRKPLESRLVVLFEAPGSPGNRYVIDVVGLRTVSGVAGDARGVLVFPAAPDPATTRGRRAAPPVDSTASRPPDP